jgi:hypothetical protein
VKTRYQILKRVSILLNILGSLLFGGGIYSASTGAGYFLFLFLGMGLLYWVSYELDFYVQELLVNIYSKEKHG